MNRYLGWPKNSGTSLQLTPKKLMYHRSISFNIRVNINLHVVQEDIVHDFFFLYGSSLFFFNLLSNFLIFFSEWNTNEHPLPYDNKMTYVPLSTFPRLVSDSVFLSSFTRGITDLVVDFLVHITMTTPVALGPIYYQFHFYY